MVNLKLKSCVRNCAFVNFTNISNAIKAIEGIKNKPEYSNLRIAHGKDRCANPPRSGPQGGSGGAKRTASSNGAPSINGMGGADGLSLSNGDVHHGLQLLEDGVVDEEHVGEMHIDGATGVIPSQTI